MDAETILALVVALVGAVIGILREFAPKTPSTFDDVALAKLGPIADILERIADPTDTTTAPTPDNPTGRP